jgi:hypothetical protein
MAGVYDGMAMRIASQFCTFLFCALWAIGCGGTPQKRLDPASWGSDHAGKPVPEYVTGDECLFCHRTDIGATWGKNRHQLTIREAEPNSPALTALKKAPGLASFAGEVSLLLGGKDSTRFLKKSPSYGKLDLLTTGLDRHGNVQAEQSPHWDKDRFAVGCAGCHTTGVDTGIHAFAALPLDCYTCHGEATLDHSKDTTLIYLARKRHDQARVVISICGQCHIRSGRSRSSGLPYPNNFVAGDNLFRDFRVDLSPEAIGRLNPGDRHVMENVRAVVLLGHEETTCLSCHDVHKQSTRKHRVLAEEDSCYACHDPGRSKRTRKSYDVHSRICEY